MKILAPSFGRVLPWPHALATTALLLVGCPVYQLNAVPPSQPLSSTREITVAGDFVHSRSQFRFPDAAASFTRSGVRQYDLDGLNISAGYNYADPSCRVAATVYVFPAPRMSYVGADPAVVESTQASFLLDEFHKTKAEIEKAHPGAAPLESERSLPAPAGASRGLGASYRLPPGSYSAPVPIVTDARLFLFDRTWFIKYRFTYAEPCSAVAENQLSALLAALKWPSTA